MKDTAGHDMPSHPWDRNQFDGYYYSTHAEIRLLIDDPKTPVGVTKTPCTQSCDPGISSGSRTSSTRTSWSTRTRARSLYRGKDGEVDPDQVALRLPGRQQQVAGAPVGRRRGHRRGRRVGGRSVSDVDRAKEEALAALEAAPDGWLGLPERRRLREAMGPWTPAYEPGGPDAGLLRRAELHAAAARRALPVWEAAFPGDRRPHDLVASVLRDPAERLAAGGHGGRGRAAGIRPRAARRRARPRERRSTRGWQPCISAPRPPTATSIPSSTRRTTEDDDLDEPLVETLAAWALAEDDPDGTRDVLALVRQRGVPGGVRCRPSEAAPQNADPRARVRARSSRRGSTSTATSRAPT